MLKLLMVQKIMIKIYQSGVAEVYYVHEYRLTHGVDFLEKCGIQVEQMVV